MSKQPTNDWLAPNWLSKQLQNATKVMDSLPNWLKWDELKKENTNAENIQK